MAQQRPTFRRKLIGSRKDDSRSNSLKVIFSSLQTLDGRTESSRSKPEAVSVRCPQSSNALRTPFTTLRPLMPRFLPLFVLLSCTRASSMDLRTRISHDRKANFSCQDFPHLALPSRPRLVSYPERRLSSCSSPTSPGAPTSTSDHRNQTSPGRPLYHGLQ